MSQHRSVASADPAPGGLLYELERRQDDVLAQLDQLDAQVRDLLESLGVRQDEHEPDAGERFGSLETS
jgi:hypothetical protein